jgi:hypothetical protein
MPRRLSPLPIAAVLAAGASPGLDSERIDTNIVVIRRSDRLAQTRL